MKNTVNSVLRNTQGILAQMHTGVGDCKVGVGQIALWVKSARASRTPVQTEVKHFKPSTSRFKLQQTTKHLLLKLCSGKELCIIEQTEKSMRKTIGLIILHSCKKQDRLSENEI